MYTAVIDDIAVLWAEQSYLVISENIDILRHGHPRSVHIGPYFGSLDDVGSVLLTDPLRDRNLVR